MKLKIRLFRLPNIRKPLRKKLALLTVRLNRINQTPFIRRINGIVQSKMFTRLYPIFGLLVLICSSIFWSILGARVNLQNSDQLVNAYLFEKPSTFTEALLPGSHSFLLKWPFFWLIKTLHFTDSAYLSITVGIVLLTVILFAWVLYRIERRPIIFGTLLLALASVLMLIPATAYPGALLPVNMAMLATRNIEYIVFIGSLMLLTRARRIRSIRFWVAVLILAILSASDRLFLYLTIGGAVLGLIAYGLSSGWNLVSTSARWIIAGILSGIGAIAILWFINFSKITHIVSQSGVGPYTVITNLHDVSLGFIYGVLHILTNFGANPAATTMVLNEVPHSAANNLLGLFGLGYLLNFIIFCTGLFAVYEIISHSLAHNKDKNVWLDDSAKLSIALTWSSIAAFGIFVLSKHYYAADARYLTIVLFGLFVSTARYLSRRQLSA
jgi:hypothetical protein